MSNAVVARIEARLGGKTDFDRAYGFQCVDFARQVCDDIGHPIGTFGGSAINGWTTGSPFNKALWHRVDKKSDFAPLPGSVIFFDKTKANPYGHVAITGYCDAHNGWTIYEQNAGTGTGDGVGANAIRKRVIRQADLSKELYVGYFTRTAQQNTMVRLATNSPFWNTERPLDSASRSEVVTMLGRVVGQDKTASVWDGSRGGDIITPSEYEIMFYRAFSRYPHYGNVSRQAVAASISLLG